MQEDLSFRLRRQFSKEDNQKFLAEPFTFDFKIARGLGVFVSCTRGDKEKDRVIAYLDNILNSYELNGRIEWRIGGRVASYLFKSAEMLEFTGALAGYTFALQNTRLVAVTGLITGVAASLSIATSKYLSTKSEGNAKILLRLRCILALPMCLQLFF